ncbi:GspH/FimT family pseudopilin [Sedimenticola sp.]|uniref:GspH/FimT family pseudopilin n=1 Tax=Sedimenticola sp. TaxID=1940285 RepID=UPI003D0C02F8
MKTRWQSGVTLIELMIGVALMAVVLGLAVPGFQELIANNRLVTQTNNLVTAIHFARAEAAKRGLTVSIRVTDNADAANEWGKGWTIFIDANGDGLVTAGEEIRASDSIPGTITMDSTGNISLYNFFANGFAGGIDTVNVCDGRAGESGRQISISATGRVRTDPLACA